MLLSIDEQDPRPLYQQIVAQVKDQVAAGVLRPGDDLPSVRELGDALGINLHTVRQAYLRLREDGVIHLRLGRRARVAPLRPRPARREDVREALVGPLNELITEAFHLRVTPEEFGKLVDELLEKRANNRTGQEGKGDAR